MRKIALFCEDSGHELFIKALIDKIAGSNIVQVTALSARRGRGRALEELEHFLKDVEKGRTFLPDAVVAALDANCVGYSKKNTEIREKIPLSLRKSLPVICAIPDPHVERWMLIDSNAFKKVFGQGCAAPDQKCEKGRYKNLLRNAIDTTGGSALLGGMEHAEEIVKNMTINKITDVSLGKFINEFKGILKSWQLISS